VNVSIVGDPAAPRYRFHGIAVADVMVTAKRPVLYVTDHDLRTFVERLPFRTGLGHTDGDVWRKKIQATGGGPVAVITPLCVMDFDTPTRHARVRSLHPGVTIDQVQANTGFALVDTVNVPVTDAPTAEELRILREVVDPLGTRQMEFKATRAAANARIATARNAR
jgi:glutaconate CoA-transferase subunit B